MKSNILLLAHPILTHSILSSSEFTVSASLPEARAQEFSVVQFGGWILKSVDFRLVLELMGAIYQYERRRRDLHDPEANRCEEELGVGRTARRSSRSMRWSSMGISFTGDRHLRKQKRMGYAFSGLPHLLFLVIYTSSGSDFLELIFKFHISLFSRGRVFVLESRLGYGGFVYTY